MGNQAILGQAGSDGKLLLYSFNGSFSLLSEFDEFECSDEDKPRMCLSLDWSSRVHSSQTPEIAVSHNTGHISRIGFQSNSSLQCINSWKAHDFEAWIAAYNYHDPCVLFTGGDDALMKAWDDRISGDNRPIFTSRYCCSSYKLTSVSDITRLVSVLYKCIQQWNTSL